MAFGSYRNLLARPHVARVLFTSLLARLPQGMSSLAVLLFLAPHIGYGRSGIATGVGVAAGGLSNVWLARLVDRLGAGRVLLPASVAYAVGMLALATTAGRPYAVQLALCAVVGLATPPITSVARGLWPRLLEVEAAQTAYALEATAQELVYIAGPAIVAVIAGLSSPAVALVVTGVTGLGGSLAFVAVQPRFAPIDGEDARRRGGIGGSGVLAYAAVGLGLTAAFGMGEVATVAFVGGRHTSAAAGVVLALWSLGSMVGGLRFGAAGTPVTDRRLGLAVAAMSGSVAIAAIAPDTVGLGAILLLGGVTIAPTLARLNSRIGAVAPEGAVTEAFGWLAAAYLVGASLGAAAGGITVDAASPRWTFLVAAAAAAGGAAVLAGKSRRSR